MRRPMKSALEMRLSHFLECLHIQKHIMKQYGNRAFDGCFITPYLDTIRVYFPGGHWTARWTFDKLSLDEVPTEPLGVKCSQIRHLQQSLGAYAKKGDPPVRITTARSEGPKGTVYGGTLTCMATTVELEPVYIEVVESLDRVFEDATKTPVVLLTSLCANAFYLADIGNALVFSHKHSNGAARAHGNLQIRNGANKYDPLYITVADRNIIPGSGLIEAVLMPVVE